MSEEKFERAGQFVLDKCTIHTSSGNFYDLKEGGHVNSIEFHEGVLNPYVHGTILFNNQGGLSNIGPIIGQETLELIIRTPTIEDPDKILSFVGEKRLHITRINSKRHIGEGTELLSVTFTSGEWVRNTNIRISRAMQGSISSMVFTLLDDVGCQKLRQIEPSKESKKYIAPNIRPFDAILNLMPQAISSIGQESTNTYMFWESKQGYHFRSLNSIVNGNSAFQEQDEDIIQYKVMDSIPYRKGGQVDVKEMLTHIIDFQTTHGDLVEDNLTGKLGSRVISHNIYQKSYVTRKYDYFDAFDRQTHVRNTSTKKSNPLYSQTKDMFGKRVSDNETKLFLQPTTSKDGIDTGFTDRNNNYVFNGFTPELWIPERRSQLGLLLNGLSITMKVHGNTFTNPGDLIGISVPYQGIKDKENTTQQDKFLNGRFMVESIDHKFDISTFTHDMTMRCVRDSLEESLDFFENDVLGEGNFIKREVYEDFYL